MGHRSLRSFQPPNLENRKMKTSRFFLVLTVGLLLSTLASGCRLLTDLSGHWLIYKIIENDVVIMDNDNFILSPYDGFYGRIIFRSNCYLSFAGYGRKCECHQDFSLFEPRVKITTDCKLIEGEFTYSSSFDSFGNKQLLLTDSTRKIYLHKMFSR